MKGEGFHLPCVMPADPHGQHTFLRSDILTPLRLHPDQQVQPFTLEERAALCIPHNNLCGQVWGGRPRGLTRLTELTSQLGATTVCLSHSAPIN
jgi:hypothetical protein